MQGLILYGGNSGIDQNVGGGGGGGGDGYGVDKKKCSILIS